MNKSFKNIALVLIIGTIIFAIYKLGNFNKQNAESLQYSDFMNKVKNEKIKSVSVIGGTNKIKGQYVKGDKEYTFETIIPYNIDPDLINTLIANNVEVEGEEADSNFFWRSIGGILPWLLIFGAFWFIMIRQLQATGSRAMSFGKSRAKLSPETKNKVTFKDVAGVDEAKEELGEVIDFLKDPKKFSGIGAKIPKGVLLVGSPGTGKTLLAKAIAGEADVPFFSISGSDFVEMFVGVGASRVRDLFDQGKKNAPCIIFIDEIDAVGRLRGAGVGGGHDEREQTLNQLLVEMDGFETNEGVIIIAATNRPDILDPALLRPGRFDRQVVVDTPDVRGREKILAVHSRKVPLAREVDLKVIARGTPGFTGADLANLVNEAALITARKNKKRVSMLEMEEAKDKVMMGPERRSLLLSDDEKEITAYHEAGHALLGWLLPNYDPVHKVTIIPRGRALGLTMNLPKEDKHNYKKSYILNRIIQSYGGLLVEKMHFNEMTTGSSNDIEVATNYARKMVCEWGMSDNLGSLTFGKNNEQIFLGREISQHRDYSEATAEAIDREVKKILSDCEAKAKKMLVENREKYQKIAQYLIERESLTGEEIGIIMKGEELPPMPVPEKKKPAEPVADDSANQAEPVKDSKLRPVES